MNIKDHLKAALKLAIGLIILFAVVDLIESFTSVPIRTYLLSPLRSLGLVKGSAAAASTTG